MMNLCPCCSGFEYAECCKRFHDGMPAPTPLALMRSRYSAYALGKTDYIQKTTHPKSPHWEAEKLEWTKSIAHFCATTQFIKLEIDSHGEDWVAFQAFLKQNNKPFTLIERSHFERVHDQWLYVDGQIHH